MGQNELNSWKTTLSFCRYITGHSAARWSGSTCAGGGAASLSAPGSAVSPSGGIAFMPGKGRDKGPPSGWCTVASYAMATSRRQRLKKWRYVTVKAHSHSPLGNQVEDWAPPLCRCWGYEKRGVWERYRWAEGVFCLVGEDKCAGRQ